MKNVIYYFSGTGNSLAAARRLADRLGGAEVRSLAAAAQAGPTRVEAERLGIVFPVYMFGPPRIVERFCGELRVAPDTYVFAVATCGGMPGAALPWVARRLAAAGVELAAGFVLKMPGNYTPLYGAPPESAQRKLLAAAERRMEELASVVAAKQSARLEASPPLINALLTGLLYRWGAPRLPAADRKFWTSDRCNGCGLCARVCPVANIELENGRPVWRHRCEQCLACLHWCPQEAIEFGRSTPGRRRYRHPQARAADFCAPAT